MKLFDFSIKEKWPYDLTGQSSHHGYSDTLDHYKCATCHMPSRSSSQCKPCSDSWHFHYSSVTFEYPKQTISYILHEYCSGEGCEGCGLSGLVPSC